MTHNSEHKIPLWRDDRFWKIVLQVLAAVVAISLVSLLWYNVTVNMQNQGIQFGFGFLKDQASFAIQESPISYNPARDPYRRVLFAGLLNSLRVMVSGIVLTTILGVAMGVASFSGNWLLRKGSQVYVEVVRNIPLLLQLFFWYKVVFLKFPNPSNRIEWLGSIYLSNRGVFLPWFPVNWNFVAWMGVLVGCAIASILLWRWRIQQMLERGQSGRVQLLGLAVLGIAAILIILFGLGWQAPQEIATGTITGGLRLSIEFSALLVGLVVYTGAYIAEIVRAGIQSVSQGQWEAARALGLRPGLTMRLVVFPQALRVMIPLLNSQYMNLAKNSSLAIAIGYADIYSIANTTYNQTGRPVEVMFIIMMTYLIINLAISLSMNGLNKMVQLQER
ncbi:ABC transporter permease subunit [Lusitaniella coriacea LEGE 07157]|uniref:ABC transporter permease subunit n=1 Tax=Lusitaniella coriacea LEGE 07157 TaxID=945747 RepID=A0A8J7J2T6_9CYAN|nr:ABC transporter permease subunit [Lusitaniella coriacea]MBE9116554.1 ABC transporter permease subunit [Lusitaniella coriacea LEGE 07157]